MPFPSLNHVALTVRDLAVSAPWYQELIGAEPVVDEHTDTGFRHVVWPTGSRSSSSHRRNSSPGRDTVEVRQRALSWSNRWRCRAPYAAAFTASPSSMPDPNAPPSVAIAATNQVTTNTVENPTE
nr:VOC family protein [Mycobacterium sp. GA-1199]